MGLGVLQSLGFFSMKGFQQRRVPFSFWFGDITVAMAGPADWRGQQSRGWEPIQPQRRHAVSEGAGPRANRGRAGASRPGSKNRSSRPLSKGLSRVQGDL